MVGAAAREERPMPLTLTLYLHLQVPAPAVYNYGASFVYRILAAPRKYPHIPICPMVKDASTMPNLNG